MCNITDKFATNIKWREYVLCLSLAAATCRQHCLEGHGLSQESLLASATSPYLVYRDLREIAFLGKIISVNVGVER